jgi:hypothetical protein
MVFESSDAFAIALAEGLLQNSGIPFSTQGDAYGDETAALLVLGPVMRPLCRFLVPADREAEARKLLETVDLPGGDEAAL